MANAVAAFGVTMTFDSIAVGEILDIGDSLGFKRSLIDVTNHGSTGGYEEHIPSAVIRSDEFTLRCNSVIGNPGQVAIKSAWANKNAEALVITCPDGYYVSGSVYVTGYKVIAEMEEQLVFECSLKWTGQVTDGTAAATAPSALVCTAATLYPTFAAGTYEYYGTSVADTCTFTLTFATSTAKLYREGVFVQDLVSEEASGSLSLGADGAVTDFQIVVSEAAKSDRVYNIHINNAAA